MAIDVLVQSENTAAELARRELLEGLPVNFHPAVDHIDVGEQLAFGTHRPDSSAEFWFTMVRKDHVLQKQGFLLGNPQFFGPLPERP